MCATILEVISIKNGDQTAKTLEVKSLQIVKVNLAKILIIKSHYIRSAKTGGSFRKHLKLLTIVISFLT